MNTYRTHTEPQFDEDDDFGDAQSHPLLGWLLMAVGLVAMAFLLATGPEASAQQVTAVSLPSPSTTTQALPNGEAAGLAYGG
jgi:hypothetical protein